MDEDPTTNVLMAPPSRFPSNNSSSSAVSIFYERIKENKTLLKCTFLMKSKKSYTKCKINKSVINVFKTIRFFKSIF
jgi:hypothetical protein